LTTDWESVRAEFPVLERGRFLNTATFGPIPRRAVEAMNGHFAARNETAALDFLDWFDDLVRVRASAAKLVGAKHEDVAFVPNAGIGLSWLLQGLDWRSGDVVLGLESEFPNNLYAPMALADRGVRFEAEPGGSGFDADRFLARIGRGVRLVLVSSVGYSSGLRPPLEAIGEACRRAGALFIVDGTQGVGATPFDMAEAQADAVLVHGYKWLCAPPGAGFAAIGGAARQSIRPTVWSWRSDRDWRNVDCLQQGAPVPPDDATRYEGGIPNFSGLLALGASLELILGLGREAVWERVESLAERARAVLRDAGGALDADSSPWFDSPIVTARFPGADCSQMSAFLRERGVAASARHGRLRVSPHFFNNEADLDALAEVLAEFRQSHR
jgi:cysteine desulfurase / selenocysteine lyase